LQDTVQQDDARLCFRNPDVLLTVATGIDQICRCPIALRSGFGLADYRPIPGDPINISVFCDKRSNEKLEKDLDCHELETPRALHS
jgi:hypothetical protein